jgi:hypothetical protein
MVEEPRRRVVLNEDVLGCLPDPEALENTGKVIAKSEGSGPHLQHLLRVAMPRAWLAC